VSGVSRSRRENGNDSIAPVACGVKRLAVAEASRTSSGGFGIVVRPNSTKEATR
jgi:hypothetical protein